MKASTIIAVLLGLLALAAGCGGTTEPTPVVEPYALTAEQVAEVDVRWIELTRPDVPPNGLGADHIREICENYQRAGWDFDALSKDVPLSGALPNASWGIHGDLLVLAWDVTGTAGSDDAIDIGRSLVAEYCAYRADNPVPDLQLWTMPTPEPIAFMASQIMELDAKINEGVAERGYEPLTDDDFRAICEQLELTEWDFTRLKDVRIAFPELWAVPRRIIIAEVELDTWIWGAFWDVEPSVNQVPDEDGPLYEAYCAHKLGDGE